MTEGHAGPPQTGPIAGRYWEHPGKPQPTMATAPPKTFLQQLFAAPKFVAPLLWPVPGFVQKSVLDASTQPASLNFARPTPATHRLEQSHRSQSWLGQFRLRDSARGRDGQTQDKRLDVR